MSAIGVRRKDCRCFVTATTKGESVKERRDTIIDSNVTENGGSSLVANGDTIAHELVSTPIIVNLTTSDANHLVAVTATDDSYITVGLKDNEGINIDVPETVYWYALCQ